MIEDQPSPNPLGDDVVSIQSLVRVDLEKREQLGIERYGTPLQAGNGRESIVDAYQEAMDLTIYLRQVIEEGGLVGRHGADDSVDNPHVETTPGRLLTRILDGDTDQRMDICNRLLSNSKQGYECFVGDHSGRIEELQRRVKELSQALIKQMSGMSPNSDVVALAESEAARK